MRRSWLSLPAVGAMVAGAVVLQQRSESAPSAPAEQGKAAEIKPAVHLPISQVILFNSGVGHFTRAGEVEGNARVDLAFPEQDINDLIKSMTLRDLSATGRVSSVTYDSHDPIDRTLQSFAINLNGSPTLANILHQARGEKIEVTLVNTANQPGNLTGSIIGLEQQMLPSKDGPATPVTVLNMWCAEGVRAVKLSEVQKLRFSNPVIENEFRRALEVLALSHDSKKKAVSLHFSGEGKRQVEVGYVIENPIWKTSYRLVLGKDGKPFLQGWAVVENPTDEDWQRVTMALVSGRPISFKMDLYNPLYAERATVEPELFAGLRPPTYNSSLRRLGRERVDVEAPIADEPDAIGAGLKGSAGMAGRFDGSLNNGSVRTLADRWSRLPTAERTRALAQLLRNMPANQRSIVQNYFNELTQREAGKELEMLDKEKKQLKELTKELADPIDIGGSVQSVATASALGDYYQYVLEQPVDLARQKSALLPIVNKPVEGTRVSIFNPAVQAKHPLLGLKFKNTAGMPLAQGPITVFEGSVYAGDTRVLDLQQDEERLISYAIDLGTEVVVKDGNNTTRITKVKAVKGIISTTKLVREEHVYDLANRSATDRTVLIEHPNRKDEGFTFVGDNKPKEEAADVFRFEVPVAARKTVSYRIIEEQESQSSIQLTNDSDSTIRYFVAMNEVPESLKTKLKEALTMKSAWDKLRQEIADADRRIQTITADQKRIRENLRETPKESPLFAKYLKTLEEQEKEMDDLHMTLKKLHADDATARTGYERFLANLSAE